MQTKNKKRKNNEKITKDDVWILIRAYNEEKTIGKVIDDLRKHGFNNILVVDDGSTDKTYEIAKSKDVLIAKHKINRGDGAASETGRQILIDIIKPKAMIFFDADGQHQAKDLNKFLKKINEGYDIVLGSRFLGKTVNMPTLRKFVLKGGIVFTYLISGIKLSDTHNGLRMIRYDALKKMVLHYDDSTYASEILDYIKKLNLKYCEVPVTIIYNQKEHAQSNFNAIKIAIKMILKKILLWD